MSTSDSMISSRAGRMACSLSSTTRVHDDSGGFLNYVILILVLTTA
jgi:hypothetical protein